ncbi:CRE-COQ-6 protein [Aphelenchoides avenae]|nr:CRE-COQ-6 protein [Aphelenchus avenae]
MYRATRTLSSFYDVVIVGGGLVGNAMACSIGLNDKLKTQSVLVLDSGKPSSLRPATGTYSNRVSAVAPASVQLFKDLGVWERLKQHRVTPVSGLYVIDSCSTSHINFQQLRDDSPIAYIVENGAINSVLYDRITESCSNVTVHSEAKVESYRLVPTGQEVW